jgi:hypothetical protein
MPAMTWLVRPRPDGGCDFVSFGPLNGANGQGAVEMREGSHLPPQMPLLKRRHRLDLAEAERRRLLLQRESGYRCSEPLF